MVAPLSDTKSVAMRLAITGGTGFVGSRLLDLAVAAGYEITALTRRPQPPREGVVWVEGAFDSREAISALVRNADAVIHVAGVVNAPDAKGFEDGNVTGTLAMLAATTASGVARFVHVSSLAAREPSLSLYGGSKQRAEDLVTSSGLDWLIVRPPAVYGPGDRELLDLFKAARLGVVPLPPKGRLSVIHADDLSRLLLAAAAPGAPTRMNLEPDDGHAAGYSHREFAGLLARAQDRRALPVSVPAALLRLGARLDKTVRGAKAKLTSDRAAYFCHPDWVSDPSKKPLAELWRPMIATPDGLRDTARWYVEQGWL
jgi:nucleoside-diphosphate-sugar epimerase